ncbi:MAG: hypothetical protein K9H58_17330 [Bacteroidales bacterium]|nr:hypothetical protein [Bacteroidales bacterium]
MKSIITILAVIMSASILFGQKQINNFEELMEALNSGKEVRAIFHYKKCQLISDNEIEEKVPDAVGGMSIEVYEYFAPMAVYNKEAFVVSSTSKLIQNPLGDGYVYNYVKVKVDATNKVKVTAVYLNPLTYEENMSENFFTEMKNKDTDGGAEFFVID